MMTSLWRGYVATFGLHDGELYLEEFQVLRPTESDSELVSEIARWFPDKDERRVSWYTGILVLPRGELVEYVHLGYGSLFENYTLLRIEDGALKGSAEYSADEYHDYKVRQFEAYKNTDEYRTVLEELSEEDDDGYDLERFLFEYGGYTETVYVDF